VAALVDTNVLVYRFDARFPDKQRRASQVLRAGLEDGSLMLAHQAILEFVAATTRPLRGTPPLLSPPDAWREVEELLQVFPILYPDEQVLRTALRGSAVYQLSWFDAHMWAYAEVHGLDTIYTEDFEHGRLYGRVRALDPFRDP
jgi:predicted nucleic acid-binding protein